MMNRVHTWEFLGVAAAVCLMQSAFKMKHLCLLWASGAGEGSTNRSRKDAEGLKEKTTSMKSKMHESQL